MAIESRYSIVVDSTPRICRQAVARTRCALTLAGIAPDRLQVNVMSSVAAAFTAGMPRWGVKFRRLPEGATAGRLNKSQQLEPGVIPLAPLTVLCDCDTVFPDGAPGILLAVWVYGGNWSTPGIRRFTTGAGCSSCRGCI